MDYKTYTDLTCRVCLNVEELMVNIYDEIEDLQSNLVEMLEMCGGLIVDRTDNLPKFLCKVCAEELLVSAKFREKCAKSSELLNQMLFKEERTYDQSEFIYATNEKEVEEQQFETESEEILNEIIVEEVDAQEQFKIEWNDDISIEHENENLIFEDEVSSSDQRTYCSENILKDVNTENQDIAFESENIEIKEGEDLILSDFEYNDSIVIDTILKDKPKSNTKQRKKFKQAPLIFDCDECGAVFSNPDNLSRHFRTHPQFEGYLHTCLNCKHSFTKQESLESHIQNAHQNTDLQIDVQTKKYHRGETCDVCGKICSSESSLKLHKRSHTGERPFLCTECPKTFKTQVALTLHLKRHAGQLDWECDVCGKGFVESSNLKVHMRTHTGEKPHLCRMCGKKFSRVYLLQLHLRTHTGEKPYKCDTCPKAYSQKCDLDIHMRSHTGVRPYVCSICHKGFVRSYALQKHVKQHR